MRDFGTSTESLGHGIGDLAAAATSSCQPSARWQPAPRRQSSPAEQHCVTGGPPTPRRRQLLQRQAVPQGPDRVASRNRVQVPGARELDGHGAAIIGR